MSAQHPAEAALSGPDERPRLVVHVVDALDAAQIEHSLLNLIRHLPPERYRHAIVCLYDRGDYQGDMRAHGVEIVNLHKRAGHDPLHYLRMFGVLRALRPDVIHTRDGAGLPAQVVAALAGVKLRVHAEHGRMADGGPGARRLHRDRFAGCMLRRLLCDAGVVPVVLSGR